MARDPGFLKAVNRHAWNFSIFYVDFREQHSARLAQGLPSTVSETPLPENPWTIRSSLTVARVINAYLVCLLENTSGTHGHAMVKASVFRQWGACDCFVAMYNVIGQGSLRHRPRPAPEAVRGSLPDKSDGLINLVVDTYVPMIIRELELRRGSDPLEFWNAEECALVCRALDSKILRSPFKCLARFQDKAVNQLMLATGVRTGTSGTGSFLHSGNRNTVLSQGAVHFVQEKRHCYKTHLDIQYMKGFSREDHEAAKNYKPVIPPVTKARNVQLEFCSTMIPLLVARRALYALRNGERCVFETMEDFLAAEGHTFLVDDEESLALFRSVAQNGQLTDGPLTQTAMTESLRSLARELCLPAPRFFNYRHAVGDTVKTGLGKDAQETVLNHNVDKNTGRSH